MFSWATLYSIWPLMARIIFFNPVAHATESVRASFLGQQGYINYWVSCTFLMVYIVLFFYLSVWALRRRLDYVSFKYVPTHTK